VFATDNEPPPRASVYAGFRRAGATIIITHFAPQVLQWYAADAAAAPAPGTAPARA